MSNCDTSIWFHSTRSTAIRQQECEMSSVDDDLDRIVVVVVAERTD